MVVLIDMVMFVTVIWTVCVTVFAFYKCFPKCVIFKQSNTFFAAYIASSKHEGGLENSRLLCKTQITFENSSNPSSVYSVAFIKYLSRMHGNLKRHNRVYILSSKHTSRLIRARVVCHVFYELIWLSFLQRYWSVHKKAQEKSCYCCSTYHKT